MKVLVVGSGGREHALCWSIARSSRASSIYVAPGNDGMAKVATRIAIAANDIAGLCSFSKEKEIDLVIVGPEQPLAEGIIDQMEVSGIRAFGPTRAASILETSKSFTKAFCSRHSIGTARSATFSVAQKAQALDYVVNQDLPLVIKADGLAAGKGVIIAASLDEATQTIEEIFSGRFGSAGETLVIEQFLKGREASLFVVSDGTNYQLLGTAQDHKKAFDGNLGPNTGGMGAYSPSPALDDIMVRRVLDEIVSPTIRGMAAEGRPFRGILYVGLMITDDGPQLIEFNIRFGDPECQVLMPRLKTDFLTIIEAAMNREVADLEIHWDNQICLTVVMVSKGYPGNFNKDTVICGLESFNPTHDISIFHSGTRLDENGEWLATGGRVLCVTGLGTDMSHAREKVYDTIAQIDWSNGRYRSDIGLDWSS